MQTKRIGAGLPAFLRRAVDSCFDLDRWLFGARQASPIQLTWGNQHAGGTRRRSRRKARSTRCEALESRQLLAVVISEFMASNDTTLADNDGEYSDWIELHNNGPTSVDLDGWYLTDRADNLSKWQFPAVSLGPDQYLLVYASEKDRANPAQPLHTNFKLGAGGEYLALVRPDRISVEFAYAPEFPPQATDVSYGLSPNGSERGFFRTPTPGQPNAEPVPDSSQAVVISELMYSLPRASIIDPEDVSREFIELHNRGLSSIDVTGWQFTRGITYTLPAATIPAGEALVVVADTAAFAAAYPDITNFVGGWQGTLSNNGETVELVDADGHLVDQVRYADQGDWATRAPGPLDAGSTGWIWTAEHDGGGKSLELINLGANNDNGQNWSASLVEGGTPGRVNSVAASNIAPLIEQVQHQPALPRSDESVTITARLTDDRSSPLTAQVHWRLGGTGDFSVIAMADDGQHDDGAAGDGLFGAILPAQADLTVVEFYVQASDADGLQRSWPAPTTNGQQETNALYQVMDAFDANAPLEPGSPWIYHVIMTPAERNEFSNINRASNAEFNATFVAVTGTGVDIRYNTGVRIRGSGSRTDPIPNNRINFAHDLPWNGVTALNVNQRRPIDQIAGSVIFRLAGIPTAEVRGVRLFGNGVDLKNGGIYAESEVLDGDFAENHFPLDADGNLYRGRRRNESPPGGQDAGLEYLGEDPANYVSYIKSTNASEADWSDVMQLTYNLNLVPEPEYADAVKEVANVEQWFRAMAVNSLIDNNEYGLFTGDPDGDDYAMYRGLEDPRFQMIPYDWDTLFGNVNRSILRPLGVPALAKLITHPEFLPSYYGQFLDVIDHVLGTDDLDLALKEALQNAATPNQIESITQFLASRADYVRSVIGSQLTVSSALNTVGNVPRSLSSAIIVDGRYPEAATRAIRINGKPGVLDGQGNWRYASNEENAVDLLPLGSRWRYLDTGVDLGTSWQTVGYDDSLWSSGLAQLGYGDGDEATVVEYGGNDNNRYVTTYFRTTFQVDDPTQIKGLIAQLIYDDGAAVYLNGSEVLRVDLAAGATYDQLATVLRGQDVENRLETFALPASALSALVPGVNTLAIEIHQGGVDSPDIGMDFALDALIAVNDPDGYRPGMNRLQVTTYDNASGLGDALAEQTYDVWYDDGNQVLVNGTLNASQTWTAAAGPYRVQGAAVLGSGATLTIEPGTTVFFEQDAKLTINGQLNANGTAETPIWFTRLPGTNSWDGLQFVDSTGSNEITHAILEYGITDDGLVGVVGSNLTLDHVTLDHTDLRRIRSIDSSLVVRNSTFTDIFQPDQAPTTDNRSEHIWGRGIPAGGQWIVEGNSFGTITGHNDSIDFDAPRGVGRYAQILNNQFAGGGDDALDMTGDVYIEGNVFRNFLKDRFNTDPGQSNTISSSGGDFWAIRNVFDNVQHAALVKEDAFMHFLNNTVVSSEFAPLYFDLPGQTSGPGRGARVEGSIFAQSAATFAQIQPTTDLTVSYSFFPTVDESQVTGIGNRFGDAHVAGADGAYRLLPGSPALTTGPGGIAMGADVPAGAQLVGIPVAITNQTTANITVAGPGLGEYRYQLNDQPISTPQPIGTPILLSNLATGTYQLQVWGRNALGQWQVEPTVSPTWFVAPGIDTTIQLSEVLADNRSAFAVNQQFGDAVELYNFGAQAVNLGGFSLSDHADQPGKYVFPNGTTLGPNRYLVVTEIGDPEPGGLPRLNFGLSSRGEGLFLFGAAGDLLDSIFFGPQLPDRSIGRVGREGSWTLNTPTLGSANLATPLGETNEIVINEWYANGDIRWQTDFIELYNPVSLPLDLTGVSLSDEPFDIPRMSELPPLTFVDGNGFLALVADGNPAAGGDHLGFRLSAVLEHVAIFDGSGQLLDQIMYYPQTSEVAQGRVPDGSENLVFRPIPTPGVSNGGDTGGTQVVLDFDWDTQWKFDATGTDLGTAWRQPGYDDGDWASGVGLLGLENEPLPEPLRTEFAIGDTTYYFRKTVNLPSIPSGLETVFSTIVDDGFVVYLNGQEVHRQGMPAGEISAGTLANRSVNEAQLEGPFAIPADRWVVGNNVIAVEVHQTATNSSDLVFGLALTATAPQENTGEQNLQQLLDDLRVSEVMYHPAASGGPEYLELENVGSQSLDLSGVRLGGGITFVFPENTSLAPGGFVVVTDDVVSFAQTYGTAVGLAGEYTGQLNNGGEELVLQFAAPLDTAILRFSYEPDWYPSTDGGGASLAIRDAGIDFRKWGERTSWLAAAPSPGRATGDALPGDLDGDGTVGISDVDLLCQAIRTGQTEYDLNGDQQVDQADLDFLIQSILGTSAGDADLDGIFDSSDLVQVFVTGEYEDGIVGNSTWAEGDWTCDGEFDSSDLVAAFQAGRYTAAATPAALDLDRSTLAAAIGSQPETANDARNRSRPDVRAADSAAETKKFELDVPAIESLWGDQRAGWAEPAEHELTAELLDILAASSEPDRGPPV